MRKRYLIGLFAVIIVFALCFQVHAVLPTIIKVTSLKINNGATTTTSSVVTLNNTVEGTASEYRACERNDFSGAVWKPYSNAPKFTLSAGNGTKTVYFQVRDSLKRTSNILSDSILLSTSSTPAQISPSSQGTSGGTSGAKRGFKAMEAK